MQCQMSQIQSRGVRKAESRPLIQEGMRSLEASLLRRVEAASSQWHETYAPGGWRPNGLSISRAIPGKADPEDLLGMTAAMGPWATRATQDPRAPAASSGPAWVRAVLSLLRWSAPESGWWKCRKGVAFRRARRGPPWETALGKVSREGGLPPAAGWCWGWGSRHVPRPPFHPRNGGCPPSVSSQDGARLRCWGFLPTSRRAGLRELHFPFVLCLLNRR